MFRLALLPLLTLFQPTWAAKSNPLKDNSRECDCYVTTSGDEPAYFAFHRYWNFQNLASSPDQYTDSPDLITASQSSGDEPSRDQRRLDATNWNADWRIQNWNKPATDDFPVSVQNSAANVFIGQNDSVPLDTSTWLTLRTSRLDKFQSAGEVENLQKNLFYGSFRFRARVRGDAGAVAGLFTFFDETNESDIEILTRDPTDTWRFTNQPALNKAGDEVPEASIAASGLPDWREWQEMRIDWLPGMSRWYVNGRAVAQNTYSVPRKPCGLILNMWSDGGEWSGDMAVGDQAELQVAWVQMIFNTSGPVDGPGDGKGHHSRRGVALSGEAAVPRTPQLEPRKTKRCTVVCAIDDTAEQGVPEVVFDAAASRSLPSALWFGGMVAWLLVWIA